MKAAPSKRDKNRRRTAVSILLLILFCYLVFAPYFYKGRLTNEAYREFFALDAEPSVQIVKVWHIVSFKPFKGSLGSWLSVQAKEYSKRFINIYFEVVSMTKEDADEQLSRGERPDVISFAAGTLDRSLFSPFSLYDNSVTAVPYCASGYLLVYDPSAFDAEQKEEMLSRAGTLNEFKEGKAPVCICDIRSAGDLWRAQLGGKGRSFEAVPIEGDVGLVQYLGLFIDSAPVKLEYAEGFIEFALNKKAQSSLSGIGLLPVRTDAEVEYETEWLKALYDSFDPTALTPPF